LLDFSVRIVYINLHLVAESDGWIALLLLIQIAWGFPITRPRTTSTSGLVQS